MAVLDELFGGRVDLGDLGHIDLLHRADDPDAIFAADAAGHDHAADGRFAPKGGGGSRAAGGEGATAASRAFARVKGIGAAALDTKVGRFLKAAEHRLGVVAHKVREVAAEAARRRRPPLDADGVARLSRALFVADFIGGYVTGAAAAVAISPVAGKAAAFLPSASVLYVAYSAARDPAATWAAAATVVRQTLSGTAAHHADALDGQAFAGAAADFLAPDGEAGEYRVALLLAALATTGDPSRALQLAGEAADAHPGPPDVEPTADLFGLGDDADPPEAFAADAADESGAGADPRHALAAAYAAEVLAAREADPAADVSGLTAAYLAYLDDPEFLAHAAGEPDTFAAGTHDESKHPRDDKGRFVSKDAIHDAAADPEKAARLKARVTDPAQREKLDAALADPESVGRTKKGQAKHEAGRRREKRQADAARAKEIAGRVGDGSASVDDLYELADHLPHLTADQLRFVATGVATRGGARTKGAMVETLRQGLREHEARHIAHQADRRERDRAEVGRMPRDQDADGEAHDAARDRLERMQGWANDRPDSLAAEQQTAAARTRLEGTLDTREPVAARGPSVSTPAPQPVPASAPATATPPAPNDYAKAKGRQFYKDVPDAVHLTREEQQALAAKLVAAQDAPDRDARYANMVAEAKALTAGRAPKPAPKPAPPPPKTPEQRIAELDRFISEREGSNREGILDDIDAATRERDRLRAGLAKPGGDVPAREPAAPAAQAEPPAGPAPESLAGRAAAAFKRAQAGIFSVGPAEMDWLVGELKKLPVRQQHAVVEHATGRKVPKGVTPAIALRGDINGARQSAESVENVWHRMKDGDPFTPPQGRVESGVASAAPRRSGADDANPTAAEVEAASRPAAQPPTPAAKFTPPAPQTRKSAAGDTFEPASDKGKPYLLVMARDGMNRVTGFDPDGTPTQAAKTASGKFTHGTIAFRGDEPRVYAAVNKNGSPALVYAAGESADDLRQAAGILAAAGLNPAKALGDVAAHTIGTGKRPLVDRVREYLTAGGVTPPEPPAAPPPKAPASPAPSGKGRDPDTAWEGSHDASGLDFTVRHGGEVEVRGQTARHAAALGRAGFRFVDPSADDDADAPMAPGYRPDKHWVGTADQAVGLDVPRAHDLPDALGVRTKTRINGGRVVTGNRWAEPPQSPPPPAPATPNPVVTPGGPDGVIAAYRSATGRARDYLSTAVENANANATATDPAHRFEQADPRHLAEGLVRSWRDAHANGDAESAAAVEAAMAHIPELTRLHAAGDEIAFDGATHANYPGAFTGHPVTVERPGWAYDVGDGSPRVIEKAAVRRGHGGAKSFAADEEPSLFD